VHFAQGQSVVDRPEVNIEEQWQCFYGIHKAAIIMTSFVQIHSIVEHHNTMYYLAWNLNGWILLLLLSSSSSSSSSSADKTNPYTGENCGDWKKV
jgi:hypothetical protein